MAISYEVREAFDAYINEVEPTVYILWHGFDPAEVLKTLDPIAYEEALLEFADGYEGD